MVAKPQSFLVIDLEGPLATGEEARASRWGNAVARAVADRA